MPTGNDIYLPTKEEIDRIKETLKQEHLEARRTERDHSYDRGVARMVNKASGYKDHTIASYIRYYDW